MTARALRTLVTMAVGGVLIVMAFVNAGSVGAAIPDRAFQVMGCNIGDYTCYYARLGGSSQYTYYCNNNYYTCTNGVPDAPPQSQFSQNVSQYCGDGGGTGCVNGSPLFTSTTPVNANGGGLASGGTVNGNILVTSGFVNVGTSLPQHTGD
jgi:hypothetical protein